MKLSELYDFADKSGIHVLHFPMREVSSASFPDGDIIMDCDKLCDNDDEKVHLAHELGHVVNAAFYNIYTPLDLRTRHERVADRWAIRQLIPRDALDRLAADGCVLPHEVAEHFGVTEELARKAIEYYKQYERSNHATQL